MMRSIETSSRYAWPALQEQELAFGLLRYAGGSSRRVNSLNVNATVTPEWAHLCATTEAFFRAHKLPAIVRMVPPCSGTLPGKDLNAIEDLDDYLAGQHYQRVAPTSVMLLHLADWAVDRRGGSAGAGAEPGLCAWLQVWQSLLHKPLQEVAITRAMLERIRTPHQFRVLYDSDGAPLSCGMAVCNGDFVGLFGIATDPTLRRRGFATALLHNLMDWAYARGARYAYLQVEQANTPALAAYSKLGFNKVYEYWYRVKHLQTAEVERQQ